MNVEAVTYGYLFIPILKARLPDALVMITARKLGERTLDLVLKCFHEELIAKEACFSKKRKDFQKRTKVIRTSHAMKEILETGIIQL